MTDPPSSTLPDTGTDTGADTSRVFAAGGEDEVSGVGRLLSSLQRGLFGKASSIQSIGRYEVVRRLGSGGSGVVYQGRDPQLGRDVAIKLLRADQRGAKWRERMVREAKAMARIEHPNVIEIYDVGTHREQDDGEPSIYIVMELVQGQDLHAWRGPERSWREVAAVYLQAARGLAAAHRHGLVHRDFKPTNAMRDTTGRVRVLDFGLVRGEDPSWTDQISVASDLGLDDSPDGLTVTGGALGTPPYMAPEQHGGVGIDARADQYSFCVALFEALYQRRPFTGKTIADLFAAKLGGELEPVDAGDVPPSLGVLVRRGLSPKPDDRHPTMAAVVDALEASLAPRRGRRVLALLGVLGVGAAAVAAAVSAVAPTCADGQVSALWNPRRQAEVGQAFAAAASTLGGQTAERVAQELEARDARAKQTWHAACEERRDGAVASSRVDAIEQCLGERQAEAEALLDAFGQADAVMVATAISAVHRLSEPTECLDPPPTSAHQSEPSYRALATEVARFKGMRAAGDLDAALQHGESLVSRAQAAGHGGLEAKLRYGLGLAYIQGGDATQGAEHMERAALLAVEHRDHGTAVAAWAGLAQWQGAGRDELGEARKALRHAEASAAPVQDDLSVQRLLWAARATIALAEGDESTALDAYRQELRAVEQLHGAGAGETAIPLSHVGTTLRRLGRLEEAEVEFRAGVKAATESFGPAHPELFPLRGNLGNVLFDMGRRRAALEQFEQALEVIDGASAHDSQRRVMILVRIAATHMTLGELDRAAPRYEQALAALERMGAMNESVAAETLHTYAMLRAKQGDLDKAVELYEAALTIRSQLEGAGGRWLTTMNNLALVLAEMGRFEQAEARARQALEVATESFGADEVPRADAEATMGKVLLRHGQPVVALEHLRRAQRVLLALQAPVHDRALLVLWIARARVAAGEAPPNVRPDVEQALREVEAMDEPDRSLVTRLTAWLDPEATPQPGPTPDP